VSPVAAPFFSSPTFLLHQPRQHPSPSPSASCPLQLTGALPTPSDLAVALPPTHPPGELCLHRHCFPFGPHLTLLFTTLCHRSTRRSPPPARVHMSSIAVRPSPCHLVQRHPQALLMLEGKILPRQAGAALPVSGPLRRCTRELDMVTAPRKHPVHAPRRRAMGRFLVWARSRSRGRGPIAARALFPLFPFSFPS
jgi:hypothetical protein